MRLFLEIASGLLLACAALGSFAALGQNPAASHTSQNANQSPNQKEQRLKPMVGNPNMSAQGLALYRSNCAFCHGLTGLGGRGPNLAGGLHRSDAEIQKIIKNGVPGSTMPAFASLDAKEIASLTAHLHQLAGAAGKTERATGDPVKGHAVYQNNGCFGCHQIGDEGSTYGPDLTRIGSARSLAFLRQSIVDPSADIAPKYSGVTVVTEDNRRITGVRVNADTFSVQLRMPSQVYRSFLRDEVKEVINLKESLMPAYKDKPKGDLDDLLAYLTTLRGATVKGGETKKAKGVQ